MAQLPASFFWTGYIFKNSHHNQAIQVGLKTKVDFDLFLWWVNMWLLKRDACGAFCLLALCLSLISPPEGYACPVIEPSYSAEAFGFSPKVTPSKTIINTLSEAQDKAIQACEANLRIKSQCGEADQKAATTCKSIPSCNYIHYAGEGESKCALSWCNMQYPVRDLDTYQLNIHEVWYDEDGNTKPPPAYRQTELTSRGFSVDPGKWLGEHTWSSRTRMLFPSDKEKTLCFAIAKVSCTQACEAEDPDTSEQPSLPTPTIMDQHLF